MNKLININKTMKTVCNELCKLNKTTVRFIKAGIQIFLFIFASGTLLLVLNRFIFNHDPYKEFIGTSIVISSFTILAEIIIGCLLIDSVFNKNIWGIFPFSFRRRHSPIRRGYSPRRNAHNSRGVCPLSLGWNKEGPC